MRPIALIFILLASAGIATGASAQHHFGGGGGGGGGGGFAAAPHGGGGGGGFSGGGGGFGAPHMSAPAPHFSAPQMSAPRFSAPSGHLAAPRAAPHFAATPRNTAPHATSRSFTASHTTARGTTQNRFAERHVTTLRTSTAAQHNNTTRVGRNAATTSSSRRANAPTKTTTGGTVGTNAKTTTRAGGTAASNAQQLTKNTRQQLTLKTPQTKNLQMHYTGGSPILRNTTLANLSSRDPAMRSLTQSTFRGNFAQSNWGHDWWKHHHHHNFVFGFVLGFVGPVFWPYAFDDVYQGIYGGYAPQYYAPDDVYAYAGAPASSAVYSSATGVSRPSAALAGGSQICSGQTQGLTDFPIERIAQQVNPDQHQQALLEDLKAATIKAVNILQAACPNELPSTPTGRLTAMRSRVEAMQQAVQVVRPALDAFYSSLSDEQKEHFNALDGDINTAGREIDVAGLCSRANERSSGLPVARIEQSLQLSVHQDTALKDLNDASAQAADVLKGSCQPNQSLTPTGRLAAMEDRLNSMLQALDTVQPALAKFYDSLSDEQKARFNRLNVRPT